MGGRLFQILGKELHTTYESRQCWRTLVTQCAEGSTAHDAVLGDCGAMTDRQKTRMFSAVTRKIILIIVYIFILP